MCLSNTLHPCRPNPRSRVRPPHPFCFAFALCFGLSIAVWIVVRLCLRPVVSRAGGQKLPALRNISAVQKLVVAVNLPRRSGPQLQLVGIPVQRTVKKRQTNIPGPQLQIYATASSRSSTGPLITHYTEWPDIPNPAGAML